MGGGRQGLQPGEEADDRSGADARALWVLDVPRHSMGLAGTGLPVGE